MTDRNTILVSIIFLTQFLYASQEVQEPTSTLHDAKALAEIYTRFATARISGYTSSIVSYFQGKNHDSDLKELAADASQLAIFKELKRLKTLLTQKGNSEKNREKIQDLIDTYAVRQHDYMRKWFATLGCGGYNPGALVAQFLRGDRLPWNTISCVNTVLATTLRPYQWTSLSNDGILAQPHSGKAYDLVHNQEIPDYSAPPEDRSTNRFMINLTIPGVISIATQTQMLLIVPQELPHTSEEWHGPNKRANRFYIDPENQKLVCCFVPQSDDDFIAGCGLAKSTNTYMRVTSIKHPTEAPRRRLSTIENIIGGNHPVRRLAMIDCMTWRTPFEAAEQCGTSIIKVTLPTRELPCLAIEEYAHDTDCDHLMTLDCENKLDYHSLTVAEGVVRTSPSGNYILISNLQDPAKQPVFLLLRRENVRAPRNLTYLQSELLYDLCRAHRMAVGRDQLVYLKKDQSTVLKSCSQAFECNTWLPRTMRTRLRHDLPPKETYSISEALIVNTSCVSPPF